MMIRNPNTKYFAICTSLLFTERFSVKLYNMHGNVKVTTYPKRK